MKIVTLTNALKCYLSPVIRGIAGFWSERQSTAMRRNVQDVRNAIFRLVSQMRVINDARGASLTCGHLGGVVVCRCDQFDFGIRAVGCSGIVADITKSTIVS